MNKQVHLVISGVVQGVLFRTSASSAARSLKLNGYVRNLSNGDVEVVAEGEESALQKMIEWCRRGPAGARVDHIEIEWKEATNRLNCFEVR